MHDIGMITKPRPLEEGVPALEIITPTGKFNVTSHPKMAVPRMDTEGEGIEDEGELLIKKQTRVGPYQLVEILGTGSTGQVCLGIHRKTKEEVAVKVIPKVRINQNRQLHDKVEREIAIMKLIKHPNVLSLYDVYESENNLFLVMEYVPGGELFEYLAVRGRLSEEEALKFFQQLICAVEFCHLHHICHRDLKPENLLLDKNYNLKIADFGLAAFQANTDQLLDQSCGTPHYASPEVIRDVKYDGRGADVWSCGVILFALLTGCLPFDDDNLPRLLTKVKAGLFSVPPYLSKAVQYVLRRTLYVNVNKRFTIADIKKNKWFQSNGLLDTFPPPTTSSNFPAVPMDQALDPDVLTTLMNLGCFNDEHTLREKLSQTESNIEKMVYYLLLERKFLRPAVQDIDFDVSDDESEFLALSFQGQLHGSGTTDPFVANRRASTNGSINELLDPTAHENIRKRTDSNLSLTQSQSQYLTESVSRHRYMSVDAALGTSPECTVVPISTGTSLPSAGVSRFATISAQSIIHEDLAGLNHTGVHGTVRNGSDVLDNHNRTHTNTASTTGRSSGTGNAVLESPSIKVPDKPVKDSSSVPNRTADKPVASKPRLTLNSETVEQNRKSLRCPSKKAPIPLATIDGSNEELSRQMGSGRESPKVLWFQELFGEKNVRIVSDDVPRDKLFQGLVDILDREHIKHQISGLANRCTITCQCSCEGEDSKGFDIPMEFKVDVVPAPEKDSFVIILMHISGDPSRFLRIVDTMKTGVRHLDPSTISQP